MANERITEDIVREHFKQDALFNFKSIKLEEQKSNNNRIEELLRGQSKTGGKGNGYPEFIISFPTNSDYIIVVECKAKTSNHKSKNIDNPKDFAVDGVLHYAKALKDGFSVIAIAVSGENKTELKVSHFYWKKGSEKYNEVKDKKLLAIKDYLQVFDDQFFISDFYTRDIAYKAMFLNKQFNDFTIPELKRCTMVSAMLLALIDPKFKENYPKEDNIKSLGKSIISSIDGVFEGEEDIVRSKTRILEELATILNEPLFNEGEIRNKDTKKSANTLEVAKYFIYYLEKYILPLVEHSNIAYDILGRFYIEFIRYAVSEQKSGLVLTPAHITELFCDLADVNLNDVVYDPCCGTGGFIVAAMLRLFKLAGNDMKKRENIRKKQICGVEYRADMFAYACSNMRFRGDGKSNLYIGDCFNYEKAIKDNHKPTVVFLNPPYDVGNARQMEFIEHALNTIQTKGRVVAIVQMSCAIKNDKELKEVKARLLSKHHLKAVLSMPDELFYPVGVVTCIMVFEANIENKGRKTWFGYFKDDGFEKRKNLGRIDVYNRYTAIKERWLSAYRNLDEIPGLSVRKEVTAEDEWCAEAYMETDYSTLTETDFILKMRDYAAFLLNSSNPFKIFNSTNTPLINQKYSLNTENWQWFKVRDLFDIEKGHSVIDDLPYIGEIPLISAKHGDNGVKSYVYNSQEVFSSNVITTSSNGQPGISFYQNKDFCATGDVNVLSAKFSLNKYIALFICTIIENEIYRFNYGRKWGKTKMQNHKIKLPVTKDGKPDWEFMENYIKSLPYSRMI